MTENDYRELLYSSFGRDWPSMDARKMQEAWSRLHPDCKPLELFPHEDHPVGYMYIMAQVCEKLYEREEDEENISRT